MHALLLLSLGLAAPTAGASEHASKRDSVPAGYVAKSYYPTPPGGWLSTWADSYAKAEAVVSNMTLAEKVNVTSGTGIYMGRCVGTTGSAQRFGIPTLCMMDAALGIRDTQNNTAFPAGVTTGATFDKDLMYQRGAAIGAEFRGKGANVHLGPTVGPLGRKPRGGRGWEGFGTDPVLQGVGAYQHVRGVQDQGVIATVKHFIGNEQEQYREQEPLQPELSANIDDRTLHELYLWPFADAVRAGVGSVMSAYNAVNGSQSGQNSYMLNGLLKDELGFQGFVMCDWLSQASGVASALAGLDMAMPGDTQVPLLGTAYWAFELSTAVLNGSMPVQRLDDMATRIVAAWFQMRQDGDFPEPNFSAYSSSATGALYPGALLSPKGVINQFVDVQADHEALCRTIARDAITMVKNDNATLPLSRNATLRLFGTDQAQNPSGPNACSDRGCNTGTLGMGWGSGTANYPFMNDPLTAISAAAPDTKSYNSDTYPLFGADAPAGSVAVVFISSDSGEGYITVDSNPGDRAYAGLNAWYGGDDLVKAAAQHFATVVVVAHTVGPLLMEEWIDLPQVKAVLVAHLPGQEAGYSLTDVLFGDHSPSGHLPYSIPKQESDYPASTQLDGFALGQVQDTFSEGLYIDYRHLTSRNVTARFLFGHGLSYTSFAYSAAAVSQLAALPPKPAPRPAKGPVPSYPATLPDPSEVAWPAGFARLDRFLYPYLDFPHAVPRPANNRSGPASGSGYPYPPGYPADPATTQPPPPAGGGPGGNPALFEPIFNITLAVTNSGKVAGKAAPQLYVTYPAASGVDMPLYQLRDFAKTRELAPGDSQTVTLQLDRRALSYWDVVSQNWLALSGEYTFWIGEGLADLRVKCTSSGHCSDA